MVGFSPLPTDTSPQGRVESKHSTSLLMGYKNDRHPVLCVEDHEGIRGVVREELARFDVKFATTYEDAVELLGAHDFSFILLDFQLAGSRTGLDVCQYAREQGVLVPIYVMTASGHLTDEIVKKYGADGVITKGRELITTLARLTASFV